MPSAARGDLLAEPAHGLGPLGAVEPVDVQLAAQVPGLVLEAAGQLALAADGDRFSPQVEAGHRGAGGAAYHRADARQAEARLRALLLPGVRGQHRVDHVAELAVHVVGEDGEADADLVRGHPRPAPHLDRVEQVLHQPRQPVVELGHQLAGGAQHRVAEQPDGPDRHRASPLAAPAVALPAMPLWAALLAVLLSAVASVSLAAWSSSSWCQLSSASIRSRACSATRSSATV